MKNGIIHYGDPIKRDGPDLTPWEAKWIWGAENISMHNWLCLRKKVTLENVPASAVARIAVDSRYWLWINGKVVIEDGQVKRGPTEEDTYFELEEFDQRLMALGIVKEGDTSGSQNCRLDPYYVERFCRIITNK